MNWTRPKLERFKKAYEKSKKNEGTDLFEFDDKTFVENFAKYLIEYLDKRLQK